MLTRTIIINSLFFFSFFGMLNAQSNSYTSSAMLTVPATYGMGSEATAEVESKEDFLPYAEPMFGMDKADYENHFSEYREGSLMDRVMNLHTMELQAIYADSKMNEINVSFNSNTSQELVVNVYDQFGQKVLCEMQKINVGINNCKVNTEELSDGFYSMVVIGDNEQFVQRFIIE